MNENRIDRMFQRCRKEQRAALVLYITEGFPNKETTRRLLPVLAESGCDLIELGVPFSDPIADGPTIQKASSIALNAGTTYPDCLELVTEFRKNHQTPLVLFGALNPFLRRGYEKASREASEAGADGILAADLPVEEAEEFHAACQNARIHLISLIAPTTPDNRISRISQASSGFLYCIARRGVTGAQARMEEDTSDYLQRVRQQTDLPLALGFGISSPEQVRRAVETGADAVVIGSALIDRIQKACESSPDNLEQEIGNYVKELANQLRRVSV